MLLWNKHEYQHSTDIFVKNIFELFHGTGFFLILKHYQSHFYRIKDFPLLSKDDSVIVCEDAKSLQQQDRKLQ